MFENLHHKSMQLVKVFLLLGLLGPEDGVSECDMRELRSGCYVLALFENGERKVSKSFLKVE